MSRRSRRHAGLDGGRVFHGKLRAVGRAVPTAEEGGFVPSGGDRAAAVVAQGGTGMDRVIDRIGALIGGVNDAGSPSPMSHPEKARRQPMETGSIKKSNVRDWKPAVPSTEEACP